MSEQKPYITSDLQEFVSEQYDHLAGMFPDLYSNPEMLAYASMTKLSEETGELSEAVLENFQRQRRTKQIESSAIPKEITDVLMVTLLLAHQFDIDINKALEEKIAQLSQRMANE